MGKYLGLFCCQGSSFKPVPGQTSSVSQERWGWAFFFLLSTQLRSRLKTQETSMRPFVHSTRHLHWTDVGLFTFRHEGAAALNQDPCT